MTAANDWIKLTSLPTKYEADLLAGRLRQAGIRPRIVKATDDPAGWLKAWGGSGGHVEMYVPASDKSAARDVLGESRASASSNDARSYHHRIQVIGRGLILLAIGSIVVALLAEALR